MRLSLALLVPSILACVCAANLAHAVPSTPARPVLASLTDDTFVYPVMGPRVSSSYGNRRHPLRKVKHHHQGVDLAAPSGAPIRAVADGQVMFADPYAGYGKLVVIQHDGGLTSHYGHCARILVQPGTHVRAGDIIGTVGSTGISTGPHLHFELRKSGKSLDPERLLPGIADSAEG